MLRGTVVQGKLPTKRMYYYLCVFFNQQNVPYYEKMLKTEWMVNNQHELMHYAHWTSKSPSHHTFLSKLTGRYF